MLLAGAKTGQLLNVIGATDVLALCTDRPKPHERLLTRALGVGKKWISVSTIASAGSTLEWARHVLFRDLAASAFFQRVGNLANKSMESTVRFEAACLRRPQTFGQTLRWLVLQWTMLLPSWILLPLRRRWLGFLPPPPHLSLSFRPFSPFQLPIRLVGGATRSASPCIGSAVGWLMWCPATCR